MSAPSRRPTVREPPAAPAEYAPNGRSLKGPQHAGEARVSPVVLVTPEVFPIVAELVAQVSAELVVEANRQPVDVLPPCGEIRLDHVRPKGLMQGDDGRTDLLSLGFVV